MNRSDLRIASEKFIRDELRKYLPEGVRVYLFGSRARQTAGWNADYDLWIDGEIPDQVITQIVEEIDESFVPFKVDMVTTAKLRGRFGERVRSEAKPWM